MNARFREFGLVALVTILIWLFAEAESVRTEVRTVSIEIRATPDSLKVVALAQDQNWTGTVQVKFEGSNSAIERIRQVLQAPIVLVPGDGLPLEAGEHPVDLRQALGRRQSIRGLGVTVAEVTPAFVQVQIDDLVSVEVVVRVEIDEAVVLESPPELLRSTVTLWLPAALRDDLGESPEAIARLEVRDLEGLPEGLRQEKVIRLDPPEAVRGLAGVRLDPPQVTVALTLRSRTETYEIPSVPVHVRLPAVEVNNWIVKIPGDRQSLLNISVSGPSELIKRIRDGAHPDPIRIVAVVVLTPDDLEQAITQKEAVFKTLPGLLRFEAADLVVPLEITRRPNPAAGDEPVGTPGG